MAGMKVTLSAAMRARDVSRPRPEDEEAAEQAGTRRDTGGSAPRPAGGPSSPAPGDAAGDGRPPADRARREDGGSRGDRGDRARRAGRKNAGSGGRARRKRR
jgi:hypothetical protein